MQESYGVVIDYLVLIVSKTLKNYYIDDVIKLNKVKDLLSLNNDDIVQKFFYPIYFFLVYSFLADKNLWQFEVITCYNVVEISQS